MTEVVIEKYTRQRKDVADHVSEEGKTAGAVMP
jgi:hypothetical protein